MTSGLNQPGRVKGETSCFTLHMNAYKITFSYVIRLVWSHLPSNDKIPLATSQWELNIYLWRISLCRFQVQIWRILIHINDFCWTLACICLVGHVEVAWFDLWAGSVLVYHCTINNGASLPMKLFSISLLVSLDRILVSDWSNTVFCDQVVLYMTKLCPRDMFLVTRL